MITTAPFFVAGGTVPPGSPSYVERAADRELLAALLEGTYCYVLNSRQMGKSSLAVRTIARLQEEGVRTAFVDLTRLGGATISAEQWYSGLLAETGRALGLRAEAAEFLRASRELGPAQRYLAFLHEVVLERLAEPVVVMIDEIDAVRSLPFSTDELFAGIRQLHNGRASDEALSRLTFCLLGAALPSDLIRDPRITPFNVGRRIELRDFTSQEAAPFADAIGGPERLAEVLKWTGGHPFLTQAICAELAVDPATSVTELVQRRYLDARARDTDTNLVDVGNRLLGRGDPSFTDDQRADVLSLFAQVRKRGIEDDESNPSSARIKMSGVARLEGGRLTIRNRIYDKVFGPDWIRENMPGQELRRQRRAFWKGALRVGAISAAVVIALASLTALAIRNEHRAQAAERRAWEQAYQATMRTLPIYLEQNNLDQIKRELKRFENAPWRGWEWDYWNRIANRQVATIELADGSYGHFYLSPDATLAAFPAIDRVDIHEVEGGARVHALKCVSTNGVWLGDSRHYLVFELDTIKLFDARSGRLVRSRPRDGISIPFDMFAYPHEHKEFLVHQAGVPMMFDPLSLQVRRAAVEVDDRFHFAMVAPDGAVALWVSPDGVGSLREHPSGRYLHDAPDLISCGAFSRDGKYLFVGTSGGKVHQVDVRSKRSQVYTVAPNEVETLKLSPDGAMLLVGTRSRYCVLYDVRPDGLVERQRFREASVGDFTADGRLLLSYWAGYLYDVEAPPEVPEVRLGEHIFWVGLSPSGELLANGRGKLFQVDLTKIGAVPQVVSESGVPLLDGRHLAGADGDDVYLLDRQRKEIVRARSSYGLGSGYTLLIAATPDGSLVAVPTDPRRVSIFRRGQVKEAVSISIPSTMRSGAMSFSGDGSMIAIWMDEGRGGVFRTTDGKNLFMLRLGMGALQLAFSPDDRLLAVVGHDERGYIVDVARGTLVSTLIGHSQSVTSVAWSPDGRRIATGGDDNTVKIWDPRSGADLGMIGSHDAPVKAIGFLPGGRTLVSVSWNGTVKSWMTEDRP
jgi:WD40 repeat protein